MGVPQLPGELLFSLTDQWPCREQQIKQLSVLLSPELASPPTLVVYGPHATGKTSIASAYLKSSQIKHAYIRCRECITGRHLLERTIAAVHRPLHGRDCDDIERCENLSALAADLQSLLKYQERFVLVFDGVDGQREAPTTMLPALARLGESIPGLTVVMIVRHPPPRFLHQTGIPHLHFPPYTRNQAVYIVSQSPPHIFLEPPPDPDYDEETHEEDRRWLWPRFTAAVWDSLAQNAARDLTAFRELCDKLWTPFVAPIIKGDFGTRDFSRLLVNQRRLFQDEGVLLDTIVTPKENVNAKRRTHELPYYAKWILVAAYLASFNPAKLDALYFMKTTERKRRKKGGGTARSGSGRASQQRRIPRHLLGASAFTLDRLMSILHAILPHDLRSTVDVYTQIATLTSLKLLTRGGGIGSSDPLEPGGKWRVGTAVSWEYVHGIARSLPDFSLIDYIAE